MAAAKKTEKETIILNPAQYHALKHKGKTSDYLHYWFSHSVGEILEAQSFLKQSEYDILQEAKNKITRAKEAQLQALVESAGVDAAPEELGMIEQLLIKPDWMTDFMSSVSNSVSDEISLPPLESIIDKSGELIQDAQEVFSANIDGLQTIEEEIFESISKFATKEDLKEYQEVFLQSYFGEGISGTNKNGRNYTVKATTNMTGATSTQAKILESLLSRENNAFFSKTGTGKYKEKYQQWEAEKTKLLAAISVLKDPQSLKYVQEVADSGQVQVQHGNGTEGPLLNSVQEVLTELYSKIQKYYNQLHAIGAEAAVGQAIQTGAEEYQKHLDEVAKEGASRIRVSGGNEGGASFDVEITENLEGNKHLFDLIKTSKNNPWSNATSKRTSKSDAFMEITDNKVTIRQGVNIKDYKSVEITGTGAFRSANISLQKGTPLLTLLTREANLSPAKMHMIFQMLTGHQDEDDDKIDIAKSMWEGLIEKLKYLTFLDVIAGFTNEQDRAIYFMFNGQLFTMIDILTYLQRKMKYEDSVRWSALQGSLEYEDYHSLDKWQGKKWRANPEKATTRSDKTLKAVVSKMYATKIEVKMHIAELASFMKMKIN